jgi:hypothetical protein
MPKSREELVKRLERARDAADGARWSMRVNYSAYLEEQYRRAQAAEHAAQDALQQWDEDHFGEES